MDASGSYRQQRFRPHIQIPQKSNSFFKSSELDYSNPATTTIRDNGHYFDTSATSHFGTEQEPQRSKSLDNRRDRLFRDDYGFPVIGTDERLNIPTKRYQSRHQRNYNYQPYLSVNTGPATGHHRATYDEQRGTDHYFDNFAFTQSNLVESDCDALDRSIRNYRQDPDGEQVAHVGDTRRYKAQSLSPVRHRHGGFVGVPSDGTKSRRHNLPPYLYRHSGAAGGFVGPQSGTSINRSESMHRTRNDISGGSCLHDEKEFNTDRGMVNYYRSGNPNHQQPVHYGPGVGPGNVPYAMRNRAMIRGTMADTTHYGSGIRKYYKLHCCCLSFRWPPWAFEEVEPPQPLYRRN